MKAKMRKVYGIHRGQLPSGTWAYLGHCRIKGKRVEVASIDQQAGSWFSYEPTAKLNPAWVEAGKVAHCDISQADAYKSFNVWGAS